MITIQEQIALAPFTTFNIGGVAKYFVTVTSNEDVFEALRYAKQEHLAVFFLGGGSNVLFSDAGFNGLVIKLENCDIAMNRNVLTVGAGAKLSDVVAYAAEKGLAGMELMAGIPGTIGGAVRGNAGAFGVEIGSLLACVMFLDTKTMEMKTVTQKDCSFSYRQSMFKWQSHLLVLAVEITLSPGNTEELKRIAEETIAKREAKHPQNLLCAGSFFMNPVVSNEKLLEEFAKDTGVASRDGKLPAGWLIDHVDLRGKTIGGAQVSEIHPNYIINTGNATAEDILILSSIVKQRVRTQLGIELKEEAQLVGF